MKRYFLLLALSSATVLAGGNYFAAQVKTFQQDNNLADGFVVELVLTTRSDEWPTQQCDTLVISGYFDAQKWASYQRPVSRLTHQRAIEYLASSKGEPILFGVLGKGLKRSGDCQYQSKGLFIEIHDETSVVFSVYESI